MTKDNAREVRLKRAYRLVRVVIAVIRSYAGNLSTDVNRS